MLLQELKNVKPEKIEKALSMRQEKLLLNVRGHRCIFCARSASPLSSQAVVSFGCSFNAALRKCRLPV